jgi:hypothetical protein
MMSNMFGGDNVIVEAKMLKGDGGIVSGQLNVNSARKRVGLIVIPTVVVRVDVITSRGDGGTISWNSSEEVC